MCTVPPIIVIIINIICLSPAEFFLSGRYCVSVIFCCQVGRAVLSISCSSLFIYRLFYISSTPHFDLLENSLEYNDSQNRHRCKGFHLYHIDISIEFQPKVTEQFRMRETRIGSEWPLKLEIAKPAIHTAHTNPSDYFGHFLLHIS